MSPSGYQKTHDGVAVFALFFTKFNLNGVLKHIWKNSILRESSFASLSTLDHTVCSNLAHEREQCVVVFRHSFNHIFEQVSSHPERFAEKISYL